MISRITPRKKPAKGFAAVREALPEAFAAAFIPNSKAARKQQRKEEYRIVDEYYKNKMRFK